MSKRKTLSTPPNQLIFPESPSSTTPRPFDFGPAQAALPEDERGGVVSFQDDMDEDQGIPASNGSGSRDVVGTDEAGGMEIESAGVFRGAKRSRKDSFPGGTNAAIKELEAVLGDILAIFDKNENREGAAAINIRVQELRSHIASLHALFTTLPRDIAEQRLRDELIRKCENIKKRLRSLFQQPEPQQPTGRSQDDKVIFGLLEDLQEAIVDYQVCSESAAPVRLGSGSFASVYVISSGLVAFKEVAQVSNAHKLHEEYNLLHEICGQCSLDPLFAIPRALGFYNPHTKDFSGPSPKPSTNRVRTPGVPLITKDIMAYFQRPTYAMDRVQTLPITARRHLASCYFPPKFHQGPTLCRLYFGKDYTEAAPSRFANTLNFPLDEARYTQLAKLSDPFLPPAAEVASAMGSMLFRLHHRASVDARDVEFILGGDGGAGFTFFVIDFNQVRTWDKCPESIDQIASPFFSNDPYYPRPRTSDALYNHFKTAYLNSCDNEADTALATAFLNAVESIQAQRDFNRTQESQLVPVC